MILMQQVQSTVSRSHERLADGPDAMPMGVARPRVHTGAGRGLSILNPIPASLALPELAHADAELFRMHTSPHLYFEGQIEAADDARVNLIDTLGDGRDLDCTSCRHTVWVPASRTRCPVCFAPA